MSEEAQRLRKAAAEVLAARDQVRNANQEFLRYAQDRVMAGERTWQGDSADRFWQRTGDRSVRLRRGADQLDALARKMENRAKQLEIDEERARQRAAAAQQRSPRR